MRTQRRERRDIMLAYPFEERRLSTYPKPWLVQPKYDGERALAVCRGEDTTIYSSTGLPIETVPHIINELQQIEPIILDGELYRPDTHDFQDLIGLTKRGSVHEDHEKVKFMVFDSVSHLNQLRRILEAGHAVEGMEHVTRAPLALCQSMDDIEYTLNELTEEGYEGIIVRHPSAPYVAKRATTMMKWKPKKSDLYRIVGSLEEVSIQGEPKGALGAVVVTDDDGRSFKVGTGFTREQRNRLWRHRDELVGHLIRVKYQAHTKDHIPRFPVFVEVL